jgi:hypothetical protein
MIGFPTGSVQNSGLSAILLDRYGSSGDVMAGGPAVVRLRPLSWRGARLALKLGAY